MISGDVEIGADCQILHGAVITAEGGAVTLGENVIVMENALIRATSTNPVHIADHVLVGPMASVSGASSTTRCSSRPARASSTAHASASAARCASTPSCTCARRSRRTRPCRSPGSPSGDPVQILPPDRHEEIWAAQRELDFPGYVFGLDRETPDLMVQLTERYGRSLARHADDRRID